MTSEEAIARMHRKRERWLERAAAYTEKAAECEARALGADEVLSNAQREFLIDIGLTAQRNAKALEDDAAALTVILEKAGCL